MLRKNEFANIWQRILSSGEKRVEEAAVLTTAFTNFAEEYPEFIEMTGIRKAQVLAAFLLEFGSRHPYPPERMVAESEQSKRWEKALERKNRMTFGLPKGWEVCEDERVCDSSYSLFTVIMERLIKKSYDPGIRTYLTNDGKVVMFSIEEIREKLGLRNLMEAQIAAERAAIEYRHLSLNYEKVEGEMTVTEEAPAFQFAVASQNCFEAKITDEFAMGLTQTWCADNNVWEAGLWT